MGVGDGTRVVTVHMFRAVSYVPVYAWLPRSGGKGWGRVSGIYCDLTGVRSPARPVF